MSDTSVTALARFRVDLSRSLSRRGEALLRSDNLAAALAALSPLETYFIIKEMGLETAVPVVRQASLEQLRTCLDLDCWSHDQPDYGELDAWLAPFAAEGAEAFVHLFLQLDSELQVLYLAKTLHIYAIEEEALVPERPDSRRLTTLDRLFVVEPRRDEAGEQELEREVDPLFVVDSLYRHNIQEAYRLMMAAKWELSSSLEEDAYRLRQGRLEDLGFPEPVEAARLFTPPKPARVGAASHPARRLGAGLPDAAHQEEALLPALYAAPLGEECLLTQALDRLSNAALLQQLERDLVYLINAAIIAYGESPRDATYVSDIVVRVRDTLCLGLQALLSPGVDAPSHAAAFAPEPVSLDPDGAAAAAVNVLEKWPLVELFRRGMQEVFALQRLATALLHDPVAQHWYENPDSAGQDDMQITLDRHFLSALVAARPLHGGFDLAQPARRKAFTSLEELNAARERLDGLAARLL